MLKELKKNKMSVVATGILFGVMGVLIIPMIAVIVKISNALSQKHPRIYKYSMIAFIGMLLSISLFCINDNLNMYINDHLRMYTSDYALI